jgi:hypothetical protein
MHAFLRCLLAIIRIPALIIVVAVVAVDEPHKASNTLRVPQEPEDPNQLLVVAVVRTSPKQAIRTLRVPQEPEDLQATNY